MEKAINRRSFVCKTWKTKTLAAVLATVAAVALPQLLHYLGMISNLGSALGETFLPMHIAIFLVAFFAGPWAGLAAGLVSPVLSFGLTTLMGEAMPALTMLPIMIVELASYGLMTGLFAGTKLPSFVALLFSQILGRGVRALAIVIGVYAFGAALPVSVIWNSIVAGLPGIILQWLLVPLLVYFVEKKAKHE